MKIGWLSELHMLHTRRISCGKWILCLPPTLYLLPMENNTQICGVASVFMGFCPVSAIFLSLAALSASACMSGIIITQQQWTGTCERVHQHGAQNCKSTFINLLSSTPELLMHAILTSDGCLLFAFQSSSGHFASQQRPIWG